MPCGWKSTMQSEAPLGGVALKRVDLGGRNCSDGGLTLSIFAREGSGKSVGEMTLFISDLLHSGLASLCSGRDVDLRTSVAAFSTQSASSTEPPESDTPRKDVPRESWLLLAVYVTGAIVASQAHTSQALATERRSEGAWEVLFVCGCRPLAYLFSTNAWDLLLALPICVACAVNAGVYDTEPFLRGGGVVLFIITLQVALSTSLFMQFMIGLLRFRAQPRTCVALALLAFGFVTMGTLLLSFAAKYAGIPPEYISFIGAFCGGVDRLAGAGKDGALGLSAAFGVGKHAILGGLFHTVIIFGLERLASGPRKAVKLSQEESGQSDGLRGPSQGDAAEALVGFGVEEECQRVAGPDTDAVAWVDAAKQYPKTTTPALHPLSLGARVGECIGILGPNGAGKSTAVRLLTGSELPSAGAVRYGSRTPARAFEAGQATLCPQGDTLWPKISPIEHAQFLSALRRGAWRPDEEDTRWAQAVCDALLLGEDAKKRSSKCSGGTKRKAAATMAIFASAEAVILDEPSTGVDPVGRRALWAAVRRGVSLRTGGVVLTTHSMQEAEAVCGRIAVLAKGTLRAVGSASELRGRLGAGCAITLHLRYGDTPGGEGPEGVPESLREAVIQEFPGAEVLE
eukprot:Hpha_TRINITY_DN16569_c1_g1::TRINITY_DN16569_c1_g1_i1::g.134471::m.134471